MYRRRNSEFWPFTLAFIFTTAIIRLCLGLFRLAVNLFKRPQ